MFAPLSDQQGARMKSIKTQGTAAHSTRLEEIAWELDGGNYSILDRAILIQGRLYENDEDIIRAVLRTRSRATAQVIAATLMPALLFIVWLATSDFPG